MIDVRVIEMDLPTSVKGFVYMDSTYQYVIVINARMPFEVQRSTYIHELKHIREGDLSNLLYREYPS